MVFTSKMFGKHLRNCDISYVKVQVKELHLYLKCHSSTVHRCFSSIFVSKSQLPGFNISGALVENGLKKDIQNRQESFT